jgi:hypothetical protein
MQRLRRRPIHSAEWLILTDLMKLATKQVPRYPLLLNTTIMALREQSKAGKIVMNDIGDPSVGLWEGTERLRQLRKSMTAKKGETYPERDLPRLLIESCGPDLIDGVVGGVVGIDLVEHSMKQFSHGKFCIRM